MSILGPIGGLPGVLDYDGTLHRNVFKGGLWEPYLPGGKVIAGTYSGDPGNTPDTRVLRAGLLMGKRTSDNKYAPSVIGVTTGAVSSGGTTVTVSAAAAAEIVRRIGATGTIRLVGPPTAAGTVATFTETYSAVNTTTGAITCSSLNADLVAGSFVCADDGSYLPLTLIPDGWGVRVYNLATSTNRDEPFAKMPVGGIILAERILPVWPSDASLRDWIRDKLNANGKFVLDYSY